MNFRPKERYLSKVVIIFSMLQYFTHSPRAMNASNDTRLDMSAYIKLVQLQAMYCDSVHLCNLPADVGTHVYNVRKMCCADCSCDPDCVKNNDCCIDYYLKSTLNGSSFNDTNEFILALNNIEDSTNYFELPKAMTSDDRQNHDVVGVEKTNFLQCSPTSVFPTAENRKIQMIAKCPNDFKVIEEISRCEKILNYSKEMILGLIPVTSKTNGNVYKNKYCFNCNTYGNDSSLPWSVLYEEVTYRGFITKFFRHADELLDQFSTKFARGRNIHFLPPNEQGVVSKIDTCTSIDIVECAFEADQATVRACNIFGSPVAIVMTQLYVPYQGFKRAEYVRARNCACISCNSLRVIEPQLCTAHPALRFQLHNYSESAPTIKEQPSLLSKFRRTGNCGDGYVFDKRKRECKHVECPMYWFIESGQCAPMFARIVNGVYSMNLLVKVNLKPTSDNHERTFEALAAEITEMIIQLFFKDKVPRHELSIWVNLNDIKRLKYYYVNVRFESDAVAFIDVLRLMATLIHNFKAYAKVHKLETFVTIINTVQLPMLSEGKREVRLLTTGQMITLNWSNNVSVEDGITIRLGRTYFCYRVFYDRQENYKQVTTEYFVSKLTNSIVFAADLQIDMNMSAIIDCIDSNLDVTEQNLYMELDIEKATFQSGDEKGKTSGNNKAVIMSPGSIGERGIWVLVAVAAVVLLLVVQKLVRDKMQRLSPD